MTRPEGSCDPAEEKGVFIPPHYEKGIDGNYTVWATDCHLNDWRCGEIVKKRNFKPPFDAEYVFVPSKGRGPTERQMAEINPKVVELNLDIALENERWRRTEERFNKIEKMLEDFNQGRGKLGPALPDEAEGAVKKFERRGAP